LFQNGDLPGSPGRSGIKYSGWAILPSSVSFVPLAFPSETLSVAAKQRAAMPVAKQAIEAAVKIRKDIVLLLLKRILLGKPCSSLVEIPDYLLSLKAAHAVHH
jgi:hypothetical protein